MAKRKAGKKKPAAKRASRKKVTATEAPSQDELMAQAEVFVKEQAKTNDNYKRILRITEVTTKGRPARVVVSCADPQQMGDGTSVCEGEREIAIQDLFQVQRCVPCQKRNVQLYRNDLARRRRAEAAKSRPAKAEKKAPAKKKTASKKRPRKKK